MRQPATREESKKRKRKFRREVSYTPSRWPTGGRERTANRGANVERRRRIAMWVAKEVIPHEAAVRAWLSRSSVSQEDVDDVIQESYARLAALDSIEHIARPDAYFFSTARNLLVRRLRRAKIVRIDTIAEIDAFVDDSHPSPEQYAAGRLDYLRMLRLIAALPERCRRIVEMRKIEGISQRDIAIAMGVTESVVENEVNQGVKAVMRAWRDAENTAALRLAAFEAGGEQAG